MWIPLRILLSLFPLIRCLTKMFLLRRRQESHSQDGRYRNKDISWHFIVSLAFVRCSYWWSRHFIAFCASSCFMSWSHRRSIPCLASRLHSYALLLLPLLSFHDILILLHNRLLPSYLLDLTHVSLIILWKVFGIFVVINLYQLIPRVQLKTICQNDLLCFYQNVIPLLTGDCCCDLHKNQRLASRSTAFISFFLHFLHASFLVCAYFLCVLYSFFLFSWEMMTDMCDYHCSWISITLFSRIQCSLYFTC